MNKTATENKTTVFKDHDEAMMELFPKIWEEKNNKREKERRVSTRELAESVMSAF